MRLRVVIILVACGIHIGPARAQNEFNVLNASGGIVYATLSFDPAPAISLGYARSFGFDLLARDVTFSVDVTKPIFLPTMKNLRLTAGSRIAILESGSWKVVNRFSLIYHATDNYLFSGRSLGFEDAILPGYYSHDTHASAEFAYAAFWRNRIGFKSEPGGGRWYRGSGGKFTFGGFVGYAPAREIDLSVRMGIVVTERLGRFNPAGPPLVMNLGVGYRR